MQFALLMLIEGARRRAHKGFLHLVRNFNPIINQNCPQLGIASN